MMDRNYAACHVQLTSCNSLRQSQVCSHKSKALKIDENTLNFEIWTRKTADIACDPDGNYHDTLNPLQKPANIWPNLIGNFMLPTKFTPLTE